jgi:uncharacterized repeat protein (TIGR03803 family)
MSVNWKRIAHFSRVRPSAMILIVATLLTAFPVLSLQAQTFTALYSFKGNPDGAGPATPTKDKQGNLYTTTYTGGAYDFGTVVKIDPKDNETVLHDFTGGSDGSTPTSSVIMDSQGNLYGTTYTGGGPYCFQGYGCGVVYELSPGKDGWTETVLHSFEGSDGAHPGTGALAFDTEGNIYGTTENGGHTNCSTGCGVVYELIHKPGGWRERILHYFRGSQKADGANPYAGVILDAAGHVYGTTYYGGTFGLGTVYRIDPSGSESILYSFAGKADGGGPLAALVQDEAGNLYGTAAYGGDLSCANAYPIGCGTVFRLDASGTETVLHTFIGYPSDGNSPGTPLVRDKAGNLYGTAGGGSSTACQDNNQPVGCGVVFKLNKKGREVLLHNFSAEADGTGPVGVTLSGGYLYGAAMAGGAGGNGTVFKLTR